MNLIDELSGCLSLLLAVILLSHLFNTLRIQSSTFLSLLLAFIQDSTY
jgi:hypothetical protein